ncbi:MAG: sensor histidine kinase [Bacteroidetes bacterium]|nr:MAG: sensor histidine kinase [Bacteroidota bacterium]
MSIIKKSRASLFWKFSVITTIVVLSFGMINIYQLWNTVYHSFEKEIDKRCKVLSSMVAEKVISPMVYDDWVNVYSILDETHRSDSGIAYIFILDPEEENIIARTSGMYIPNDLKNANSIVAGNYNIQVIETRNYKYDVIRDIAYPIMNGEIGIVRMGIVEDSIRSELREASKNLLLMIGLFLLLGLCGAFFFSYIITAPIKTLSQKAKNIDLDFIEREVVNIHPPRFKRIFNFFIADEMDVLISAFNLMMARLRANLKELKSTRDSFVQTEKLASIGTLTSGIGHEINNPLSGIKNGVNRILKNPGNTEQNLKYLGLISEATVKIENVVQQLLNFSRKQDIVFEVVNPAEVLETSISLAGYKLKKHRVEVVHSLCCVQYIKASVNHLGQVFLNLLLNSIDSIEEKRKIIPDYEGVIRVTIECKEGKSFISFIDNGIGIKPENISKIYDPFYTSKDVGKGTGLGLYVSFDIIKEHGGKLSCSSNYGKGAEFFIELPLEATIIPEQSN